MAAPASAIPSGSKVAFEELYRSSRDDVFAFVAGMLRDQATAEDVTATAFERAYRRSSSFDERRGSRRAWLFGIARNAALDELRRRKRVTELTTEPVDEGTGPDEGAEVAMHRAVLRQAMAVLTDAERELVGLRFFAGLTIGEIAAVISTSERAAAMRVHRTIEKLREACDGAA
ncbi:MAG: sigma-70 family RNA polymerase sigma factor [Actinomycetota bacterium]|nr:sigma-70 family RNA polymerase sigma factor [Actinomycetota bacterium]